MSTSQDAAGRRIAVIGPPSSGKSNLIAAVGVSSLVSETHSVQALNEATKKLFRMARANVLNRVRLVDQATSEIQRFEIEFAGARISCVDSPGGAIFGGSELANDVVADVAAAQGLLLCLDLRDEAGMKLLFQDLGTLRARLAADKKFARIAVAFTKADKYFAGSPSPAEAAARAVASDEAPRWIREQLGPLLKRADENAYHFVSAYGFDARGRPNVDAQGAVADGLQWTPFHLTEAFEWVAAPSAAEVAQARAEADARARAEADARARAEADARARAEAEARAARQRARDEECARAERAEAKARATEQRARDEESAHAHARERAAAKARAAEQRRNWLGIVVVLAIVGAIYGLYQTFRERKRGETCREEKQCASGLTCSSMTCRSRLQGTCVGGTDCAEGLVCSRGACRREREGRCETGSDCAGDLVCLDQVCRRSPQARGGTCDIVGECASGLKCLGSTCRNKSACRDDGDCSSSDHCAGGTCVPRRRPRGSACTSDANCELDLVCRDRACRDQLKSVGGRCDTKSDCIDPLVCENGVCGRAPEEPVAPVHEVAPGDPCSGSDRCTEGTTCLEGFCGNAVASAGPGCSPAKEFCPIRPVPKRDSGYVANRCRLKTGDLVVTWGMEGAWYKVVDVSPCRGAKGYLHRNVLRFQAE